MDTNNQDWIRSEHIWVHKDLISYPNIEQITARKCVGTYAGYSEIFGETEHKENSEEILIKEINNFDFTNLLVSLAKLNILISPFYNKFSNNQFDLLKGCFYETSFPFQKLLQQHVQKHKILFHQQILALLKLNVLENKNDTGTWIVPDHKEEIFSTPVIIGPGYKGVNLL